MAERRFRGQTFVDARRNRMQTFLAGIQSGTWRPPSSLPQAPAQGPVKMADTPNTGRYYDDLLGQIAYEYQNYGGLTPELKAQIAAARPESGFRHERDTRQMAANQEMATIQSWAQSAPTVSPDANTEVQLNYRPEGMDQMDWMKYYTTNAALKYMDPTTRALTQQALATQDPFLFRAYRNVQLPADTPSDINQSRAERAAQDYERLTGAAQAFDYDTLRQNLPAQLQGAIVQGDPVSQGPLNWMKNYLQTAAQGAGPQATRRQQRLSQQALASMEGQAQNDPYLSRFLSTARNIVNPSRPAPVTPSMIGQDRNRVQRPPRRNVTAL